MKRLTVISLSLVLILTGCATVWKTLGVATVESVEAENTRTARRIDELAARVAANDEALAKVGELERLVEEIRGRMDDLSADTLARLAELLAKAAEEARRSAEGR